MKTPYDDAPFDPSTEAGRLRAKMQHLTFGGAISRQIESELKASKGHIDDNHRRAGINPELAYRDWLAVIPALVYQGALTKAREPGVQYLAEGPDVKDLREKRTGAEAFLAAYELHRGIKVATCDPLSDQDRLERRVRLAAARKDDPYLPARLDREVGKLLQEGGAWITSIKACETDLRTWRQQQFGPWPTSAPGFSFRLFGIQPMLKDMIDPNDWPTAPLQILDADFTDLPMYDPESDGPKRPPWVIRVIECWGRGMVPIASNWHRVHHPNDYWTAFKLDGIQ